jgi:predicted ester cyclase
MAVASTRSAPRRFFEDILSTGDWSHADDIASPELVMHHPSSPKPIAGRDRVKEVLLSYRAAFPDMKFKVDDEFGCGDKVVLRWRASGTNTGNLFGIPPTGRRATITGLSVMRVQADRVVEDWVQEDALGMMQQLGLLPAPS